MKHFEGKTAVVTGAASGIGFGLAERFAQENMQVVMADVEEEALEKAVERLEQHQHRVTGVRADVLVKESIEELFAKAQEQYGNIHIYATTLESELFRETGPFGRSRSQTGTGPWASISMGFSMASRPSCLICKSTAKKGTW